MTVSMVERVARAMAEAEGWRWEDDKQMVDRAAAGLQHTNRERDTWRSRAVIAFEGIADGLEELAERRQAKKVNAGNSYINASASWLRFAVLNEAALTEQVTR